MMKTIWNERHRRLIKLVTTARKNARIGQVQLAKKLNRTQTWVSRIETGERRLDVIELIDLAEAIGFDVSDFVAGLQNNRPPAGNGPFGGARR
jgi:transcriptional regulator with XRE-family HTH domain